MKDKVNYAISVFLLVILILIFAISITCVRIEVPTGSMQNTIQVNQQLLVLKDKFVQKYNRGDIVVFIKDNEILIKRLIGLPGENIRIENGTVFVDGKLLFEDYLSSDNLEYCGACTRPENSYFFLGDNREFSMDARFWEEPFVDSSSFLGKAFMYYYPNIGELPEVHYE